MQIIRTEATTKAAYVMTQSYHKAGIGVERDAEFLGVNTGKETMGGSGWCSRLRTDVITAVVSLG